MMSSMIAEKTKKQEKDLGFKTFNNNIDSIDKVEALDYIEKLKRKMKKCAQNFQFEDAAILRDQIIKINGQINE